MEKCYLESCAIIPPTTEILINRVLNDKFRFFKKIPIREKLRLFEKSRTFKKITSLILVFFGVISRPLSNIFFLELLIEKLNSRKEITIVLYGL